MYCESNSKQEEFLNYLIGDFAWNNNDFRLFLPYCFFPCAYVCVIFLIFFLAHNDECFYLFFFFKPGAEDSVHGGLKLLGRLALLTEKDLWTVNGLPNENNSSDHLPLLAEFRLIER